MFRTTTTLMILAVATLTGCLTGESTDPPAASDDGATGEADAPPRSAAANEIAAANTTTPIAAPSAQPMQFAGCRAIDGHIPFPMMAAEEMMPAGFTATRLDPSGATADILGIGLDCDSTTVNGTVEAKTGLVIVGALATPPEIYRGDVDAYAIIFVGYAPEGNIFRTLADWGHSDLVRATITQEDLGAVDEAQAARLHVDSVSEDVEIYADAAGAGRADPGRTIRFFTADGDRINAIFDMTIGPSTQYGPGTLAVHVDGVWVGLPPPALPGIAHMNRGSFDVTLTALPVPGTEA